MSAEATRLHALPRPGCAPVGAASAAIAGEAEISRWFEQEVQPHEPALRAYLHGLVTPSDIDDLV